MSTFSNNLDKSFEAVKRSKGFVILFTILICAIIMMIGLGIYSIATRETALSGASREAQYSFYAADSGVECALFAQSLPSSSNPFTAIANGTTVPPFQCGALPVNMTGTGLATDPYVFDVLVDNNDRTCAHVSIYDISGSPPSRRVISQGYNLCSSQGQPIAADPLLVERDLDTTYQIGGGSSSSTSTNP